MIILGQKLKQKLPLGIGCFVQHFTGLEACMFFEGGRKMRNGGITQLCRDLGYSKAFLIEQVPGMFHPLVLVKIKNGGPEHHLESFFEIAFIDGRFSAQLPYGDGIADMGKQDFPCFDDLFPFVLMGKKFTGRNLIFPDGTHRL